MSIETLAGVLMKYRSELPTVTIFTAGIKDDSLIEGD
jgi:hypothetical protein